MNALTVNADTMDFHAMAGMPCGNLTLQMVLEANGELDGRCGSRACTPPSPSGAAGQCHEVPAERCERFVGRKARRLHACTVSSDGLQCETGPSCIVTSPSPLPAERRAKATAVCTNATLNETLRADGAEDGICAARACAPAPLLSCEQLDAISCMTFVEKAQGKLRACRLATDGSTCELGERCKRTAHSERAEARIARATCSNTTLNETLEAESSEDGVCAARSCTPPATEPPGAPVPCSQLGRAPCERHVAIKQSKLHACRLATDGTRCELGERCKPLDRKAAVALARALRWNRTRARAEDRTRAGVRRPSEPSWSLVAFVASFVRSDYQPPRGAEVNQSTLSALALRGYYRPRKARRGPRPPKVCSRCVALMHLHKSAGTTLIRVLEYPKPKTQCGGIYYCNWRQYQTTACQAPTAFDFASPPPMAPPMAPSPAPPPSACGDRCSAVSNSSSVSDGIVRLRTVLNEGLSWEAERQDLRHARLYYGGYLATMSRYGSHVRTSCSFVMMLREPVVRLASIALYCKHGLHMGTHGIAAWRPQREGGDILCGGRQNGTLIDWARFVGNQLFRQLALQPETFSRVSEGFADKPTDSTSEEEFGRRLRRVLKAHERGTTRVGRAVLQKMERELKEGSMPNFVGLFEQIERTLLLFDKVLPLNGGRSWVREARRQAYTHDSRRWADERRLLLHGDESARTVAAGILATDVRLYEAGVARFEALCNASDVEYVDVALWRMPACASTWWWWWKWWLPQRVRSVLAQWKGCRLERRL